MQTKYKTIDGKLVTVTEQNCDQILRDVADRAARKSNRDFLRYQASVPMVLAQKWAHENGVKIFSREWEEITQKMLRDSDYSKLTARHY